jgi:CheY-like chemotaxis protein
MLLVEDEDDLRALLEEYLLDNGISVVSFGSADKALQYWRSHADNIDLILTDMRMPGNTDGIGLAREIREAPSSTVKHQPEIVMISGFEPPPQSLLQQLKIDSFISKPFRVSELSRLCKTKLEPQKNG